MELTLIQNHTTKTQHKQIRLDWQISVKPQSEKKFDLTNPQIGPA